MLNFYQETIASIRDRRSQASGTVSVGIPSTTSFLLAGELYRRVREELPEVTLYLADSSTAMLYEWLLDGRIDFSVLFSLPENANLELIPLGVEEFCLVSRADHPTELGIVDFDDIFDFPLVVSCQSTTWRKILDDIAERRGKSFKAALETESVGVIKAIIQSGEACGLLPLSSVRREMEEGSLRVRRLVNPEIRGVLALASLPSSQMTPAKRAVRDLIVSVASEIKASEGATLASSKVTPILRVAPSKLLPSARRAS